MRNNQFIKALSQRQRDGMTLIEIMIVVTIMVAMMGLIGYNVIGQADKASIGIAETQLGQIKQSVNSYRIQYRKYPESLDALVNTPDKHSIMESVPKDPWDNDYIFEKSGNKIKIYSAGPDGSPNNEDDIVVNVGN